MDAQSDSGLYPTSISWPPKLSKEQLAHLLSEIKDWSIARGLAVRPQTSFVAEDVDPTLALATTAPVTLFPSLLPRRQYEQARGIQKVYNELYAHIASEPEWIREAIEQ